MSCGDDPAANLAKAYGTHRSGGKKRRADRLPARVVSLAILLPERGSSATSSLPNRFPDRAPSALGEVARRKKIVIVASLVRAAHSWASTTIPRWSSMPTARSPASIARCISPTIRSTTKSFISRRAIWAFPVFKRATPRSRCSSAGTSGFPKGRGLAALSGAQILFYPTAIGWIPNEPRVVAQNQRNAWELIQRSHAIANGVFVASVNRVGSEGQDQVLGQLLCRRAVGRARCPCWRHARRNTDR